jgi:hypothetical protein
MSSTNGFPYLSPLGPDEEANGKRNLPSSPGSVIADCQMSYPIRKLSREVHPNDAVVNDDEFLYPKETPPTGGGGGGLNEWGVLQPSSKYHRTMDPMRAIVEPLVANVRSGEERGDGKDPILLGVSAHN